MASDVIDNYEVEKAFEFVSVSELKTTFHYSKVLNGEIGEYLTIVRKNDSTWYLGSATNEDTRKLIVKLDFLDTEEIYNAKISNSEVLKEVLGIKIHQNIL